LQKQAEQYGYYQLKRVHAQPVIFKKVHYRALSTLFT